MRYYEVLSGGYDEDGWDADCSKLISEEEFKTETRDRAIENLALYEEIQRKEDSGEAEPSGKREKQFLRRSIQGFKDIIAEMNRDLAQIRLEEGETEKA